MEYSDSILLSPDTGLYLALDSGSPTSSIAACSAGSLSTRSFSVGDSSTRLIHDFEDLLREFQASPKDVAGLVALRGPGSFTGLRVGLATILGLHQALGTPAASPSTFQALFWQARRRLGLADRPVLAVINALRGEWFVQRFSTATDGESASCSEPKIENAGDLAASAPATVIGFGLEQLEPLRRKDFELIEAEPLAPDVLSNISSLENRWDASALTRPLYLRPPAAQPQKPS